MSVKTEIPEIRIQSGNSVCWNFNSLEQHSPSGEDRLCCLSLSISTYTVHLVWMPKFKHLLQDWKKQKKAICRRLLLEPTTSIWPSVYGFFFLDGCWICISCLHVPWYSHPLHPLLSSGVLAKPKCYSSSPAFTHATPSLSPYCNLRFFLFRVPEAPAGRRRRHVECENITIKLMCPGLKIKTCCDD